MNTLWLCKFGPLLTYLKGMGVVKAVLNKLCDGKKGYNKTTSLVDYHCIICMLNLLSKYCNIILWVWVYELMSLF